MKTNKYCLFSGRHELPENEGALFSSFDFETYKGVKTPLYDEMFSHLNNNETCYLYVTGLTPALCEVLSRFSFLKTEVLNDLAYGYANELKPVGRLVLLHYNAVTSTYKEVEF
jgi:hypothetical protein